MLSCCMMKALPHFLAQRGRNAEKISFNLTELNAGLQCAQILSKILEQSQLHIIASLSGNDYKSVVSMIPVVLAALLLVQSRTASES